MTRYFVDQISEVLVSDDKSFVSLVCCSKNHVKIEQDFQIVLPRSSFNSMADFFYSVKKQLSGTEVSIQQYDAMNK